MLQLDRVLRSNPNDYQGLISLSLYLGSYAKAKRVVESYKSKMI